MKSTFFILILLYFTSCIPVEQQGSSSESQDPSLSSVPYYKKSFEYKDKVYEDNIKTVNLYPLAGEENDMINPPVVHINQRTPLLLEFDELNAPAQRYFAKIYHCNRDWSKSDLSSVQYLDSYNEFYVDEWQSSMNTRIPYVHYSLILPKVKQSGNYLIAVHREQNEEDIILTKRFVIYEDLVGLNANIEFAKDVGLRNNSQQVDFKINYKALPAVINPTDNIKAVIRKNYRWGKAITNLQPRFVREHEKVLDYSYFKGENSFKGINEYRAFDIRSINTYQLNIGKIIPSDEKVDVFLMPDISKRGLAYAVEPDIDGQYTIKHYESGDKEVIPDYVNVTFSLKQIEPVKGKIYVLGAMNNWEPSEEYAMIWNQEDKMYRCQVPLKQGYYNYRYALYNSEFPDGNESFFEGSHSQTQNQYDILVYFRAPGSRGDQVVGYLQMDFLNSR